MMDKESVELEFENFCELWEIDSNIDDMNEEDRDSFNSQKAKIINAIKRERFAMDEKGTITYIFAFPVDSDCEEIAIKRPKGAALMEMDKYKDRQNMHKIYAVLGVMTGKSTNFFARLDGIDLKPFTAVVSLFLAS